ncbi:sporulation integral membrane protein YlbJ [Paenibacillus naphthalenovorans]|uniref:Membrane protein n=1 Tax=Paenibacillus naphthalenovorans TaxID=162209 RepID=A0A0U2VI84_9BACL|nr:sporulation integral membrane protein YlbJ [Paenibacillus naphthalenovorans]ALS20502.1 membrane protein [Paenibacillus naphthalenovorans]GCL73070.1 sporulation integral membrane protein YlbJ [Paenibacillus naphthalenovorans]
MRTKDSLMIAAALLAAMLACLMLAFPAESFHASLRGIAIWWDVLFPALFPFFVISEIMLGVGMVHFFGTLLDPLMQPLFRVPGIGGFVMAMGFASGYPIGARLTSQLWEQRLINREEGERLVAFTTSSDPIFLIGAVSVGFFHNAALATVLAAAHYGSAILIGLLMRFHGKPSSGNPSQSSALSAGYSVQKSRTGILRRAFEAMHHARLMDGRSLGVMLQQAIYSGLKLMFVVGGLVVFFSVVMEVMTSSHVMVFFYAAIDSVLQLFGMPPTLSQAVVNGFFEVTLGAKSAGAAENIPLMFQTAIAAWVLSWAGLSVHAQIVSILHHTDLRYIPFIVARFIHGLMAAVLVIVLWKPLGPDRANLTAFIPLPDVTRPLTTLLQHTLPAAALTFTSVLGLLLLLSFGCFIGKRFIKRM